MTCSASGCVSCPSSALAESRKEEPLDEIVKILSNLSDSLTETVDGLVQECCVL